MKKIIFLIILFYYSNSFLFSVKLILPDKIEFAENLSKETLICNLDESGIFQPLDVQVMNDFIIVGNGKPIEIVKLNLSGKVLIRSKNREGRGPGEFVFCISPRKVNSNIVFIDLMNKILFYDFDLNFVKEMKFSIIARDFLFLDNKYFVFPENSTSNFYLGKYSLNGELKKRFGNKMINEKDELFYLNKARLLAYDEVRKKIWIAISNKYELKSFYNETLKDEIKTDSDFFKKYKALDKETGEKDTKLDGKGIKLIILNNNLFYFFKKKNSSYFDIFDLKNIIHKKRYKLTNNFKLISHLKNNIFYGITLNNEGDTLLCKIEIQ
jgi:hypothetical protein